MPRFSRILRVLLDKGVDMIFEGASRPKPVEITPPPELREAYAGADELLAKSREILGPTPAESKGTIWTPDYCLECSERHIGIIRDALSDVIRWIPGGESKEKITEKVMDVNEALNGMESDLQKGIGEPLIKDFYERQRSLRKLYWSMRFGSKPTVEKAKTLRNESDQLLKRLYEVAPEVKGGGVYKYCQEWGAKNLAECVRLWQRGQEGGITPKEFEERFHQLTGKRADTEWDERGRIVKVRVKEK